MEIKKFDKLNEIKKYYGGQAGKKLGFKLENGQRWFLKFPTSTSRFEDVNISYTNSSISEYIGSKIYEILGFDVHKVELGIYENKLVVACRDFTTSEYKLYGMNELINRYTDNVEFKSPKSSENFVNIEELLFNFENNKDMKEIEGLKERFYDMFVVDAFINNNDRHNGNWGILSNEEKIKLAPIFDNGNSFFLKHDLEKIKKILANENRFNSIVNNGKTPYEFKGRKIDSIRVIKKMSLNLEDKSKENLEFSSELKKAIKRVVPKIELKKIFEIIDEIPEKDGEILVMPLEVKQFYKKLLEERFCQILKVAVEKI